MSQTKALVTREDLFASRKTKTLDELLLEIEQLSHERESSAPISDEPDEEEETCLLPRDLGKAIIDGRCLIEALTLDGRSGKGDHVAA